MRSIVLIDAKNQLYRMAFAPALKGLSTKAGFPTGAIFGCLNYSLLSVFKRLPEASFIWCWDGYGETWRHKMMNELPQVNSFVNLEEDAGASDLVNDFQQNMVKTSFSFMGVGTQAPLRKPKKKGYKANRNYIAASEIKKGKYPTDDKERAILQIS